MAASNEFKSNTYVTSSQRDPAASGLADGGFVVVWDSNGVDGDRSGIAAQMYNADGTMQGGEFIVNSFHTQTQIDPVVAGLNDGGFVVVWYSPHQSGTAEHFAQIYNADGTTRGGEIALTGTHQAPTILALDNGGFLVGNQTIGGEVSGRHYDANGALQGSAYVINTDMANQQTEMSLTQLNNGLVVATWQSYVDGTVSNEIRAQMLLPDGTKSGVEFSLNVYQANGQIDPEIAALSDGGFVATWTSWGQDGNVNGVYARVFNADGSARTGEFLATSAPLDAEDSAQVVGLSDGRFMITWREANYATVNKAQILGQTFNADGTKSGGWFEASQSEVPSYLEYDLAALSGGRALITYHVSNSSTTQDDVFSRILIPEPQGTSAADVLKGSIYGDVMKGGRKGDILKGFQGRDELYGGKGNDTLKGYRADDRLFGNTGQDSLLGGTGEDTLIGGKGNDILEGGAHADEFRFRLGDGSDQIDDFDVALDTIKFKDTGLSQADLAFEQNGTALEITLGDIELSLQMVDIADQNNITFEFV